jgi:very-short-patch-repair endonuclease
VKKSSLEKEFALIAKAFKLPPYVAEFRFHEVRKFRFDCSYIDEKVAIELEGGVFRRGRHTSGAGYTADCTKYNLATQCGWLVLRYTSGMLKEDPKSACDQIKEVLKMRKKGGG